MPDSFRYNEATSKKTIFEGGRHLVGCLYKKVEICKYEGRWYFVTTCMTDPMNAGGRHDLVPSSCIKNGEVDEKALLKHLAQTETYMETLKEPTFSNTLRYASEGPHGDQITFEKTASGFYACVKNDKNPEQDAAGGCSKPIPEDILCDYSHDKMNAWLRFNFYNSAQVAIVPACAEQEVKNFFALRRNPNAGNKKAAKKNENVTQAEMERALKDAAYYGIRKILFIVFSVILVPSVTIGLFMGAGKSGADNDVIALNLFPVLFCLLTVGYCIYAICKQRAAKRVIERYRRQNNPGGSGAGVPLSDLINEFPRASEKIKTTLTNDGYHIEIVGSSAATDVPFLSIEKGYFDDFCKEQKEFASALYESGYNQSFLEYIWEYLKKDFLKNRVNVLYAEESAHLHSLGTVDFIPPRVREGEHEYYAIDDRDGKPYYVVESNLWWADRNDVRVISKTPITFDDVKKHFPNAKIDDMCTENLPDSAHSSENSNWYSLFYIGHGAGDAHESVEIMRLNDSSPWQYKVEAKGGGDSGIVPAEFIQDGNVDKNALPIWLAKKYPYLCGLNSELRKNNQIACYDRAASAFEEDAEYLHVLGRTALSDEPIYGKSEAVAVDERDNKAYYIITQTDGRVNEATHYHTKKEIPFSEIPTKYLDARFDGINEGNWKRYLQQKTN